MEKLRIFNANLEPIGVLVDADQVTRKRRLNSDYELSFLVPMDSVDYTEKIALKGHVMDEQGQIYVINSRKRDRTGQQRMALITCMHVMFKLADYKFPYASYIDEAYGVSIHTLTNLISAATGNKFTFALGDSFDLKDVKDFGRGNCLQELNRIIALYGCEVDPNNFEIHLREKIGTNKGAQYRIAKNIMNNSFTDDAKALVTRMYSQMKDGLTFINLPASNLTTEEYALLNAIPGAIVGGLIKVNYLISPFAGNWTNSTNAYYDGEFVDQNIEDPLELLEATRRALRESEVPAWDIRISSADLHKIDRVEPTPQLGDEVLCIDPDMELSNINARIVEITEYPFAKDRHAQINLANFLRRDYNDIIADLDRSKRIVDNLLSGGRLRTDALESFAKSAIIDIDNSKTEVLYDTRGIVLKSKTNPLHLVVHSANGTYMTKDGGMSDRRTAITADGIAASYIVGTLGEFAKVKTDNLIAGSARITSAMIDSINANQINAGTLSGFTITGSQIQTSSSYPRSEMNLSGNFFAAYATPDTYLAIQPLGVNSVPSIGFIAGGQPKGFMLRTMGGTMIGTFDNEDLTIQTSRNYVLNINGNIQVGGSGGIGGGTGVSGSFYASSTQGGPADMKVTFTKGIRTG